MTPESSPPIPKSARNPLAKPGGEKPNSKKGRVPPPRNLILELPLKIKEEIEARSTFPTSPVSFADFEILVFEPEAFPADALDQFWPLSRCGDESFLEAKIAQLAPCAQPARKIRKPKENKPETHKKIPGEKKLPRKKRNQVENLLI